MNEVFADTFYFLALLGADVEQHQRAVEATIASSSRLVTTAWIITELGNTLTVGADREAFLTTLRTLESDTDVLLLPPDVSLFESGIRLFAERADKEWSLTDCISFAVMRERGMIEALTGDHHFEQAGFVALLR